jgi:hypothetical protein
MTQFEAVRTADSLGADVTLSISPKRAFDIALSGIGLVVSSPLWAVVAVSSLEDGGPVFYRQERSGLNGICSTSESSAHDPGCRSTRGRRRPGRSPGDGDRASSACIAMDELPVGNIFRGDMVSPALGLSDREDRDSGRGAMERWRTSRFRERSSVRPGRPAAQSRPATSHVDAVPLRPLRSASLWLDVRLIALVLDFGARGVRDRF